MCNSEHNNESNCNNSIKGKKEDKLEGLSEKGKEVEPMKNTNDVDDSNEHLQETEIHNTSTNFLRHASNYNIRRPQKSARPTRERNTHARTTSFPQNEDKPLTIYNKSKTKSNNSSFYYASNGEKELPPIRHIRQQSATISHVCKPISDNNNNYYLETNTDSMCRNYHQPLSSMEHENATMQCLADNHERTLASTEEINEESEIYLVTTSENDKQKELPTTAQRNDACDVLCTTFETFYARCRSISNKTLLDEVDRENNKLISAKGKECTGKAMSETEHIKEQIEPLTSSLSSSLSSAEVMHESNAPPIILSNSVECNIKQNIEKNGKDSSKNANVISAVRLPQMWEIAIAYVTLQTLNSPTLAATLATDKLTHLLQSWNYSVNELLNAYEHITHFKKSLIKKEKNSVDYNDVANKVNNDNTRENNIIIKQVYQEGKEFEEEFADSHIAVAPLPASIQIEKKRAGHFNIVDSISVVCQELLDSIITERKAYNISHNNFQNHNENDKEADCHEELRICRVKVELEILLNKPTLQEKCQDEMYYEEEEVLPKLIADKKSISIIPNSKIQHDGGSKTNIHSNLHSCHEIKREYVHKILNNAFFALLQRSAAYLTNTSIIGYKNIMESDNSSENKSHSNCSGCNNNYNNNSSIEKHLEYYHTRRYHTESWEDYITHALFHRHVTNITETSSSNIQSHSKENYKNEGSNSCNGKKQEKLVIPFALHYQLSNSECNATAEQLVNYDNTHISRECSSSLSSLLTIMVFCVVKSSVTGLDANNEQSMMNWDKEVTYAALTQLFPQEFIFANNVHKVGISHTHLNMFGNSSSSNKEDNNDANNNSVCKNDEEKESNNTYTLHKTRNLEEQHNLYNELNTFRVVDVASFREMLTYHMTSINNANKKSNISEVKDKNDNSSNSQMQFSKQVGKHEVNGLHIEKNDKETNSKTSNLTYKENQKECSLEQSNTSNKNQHTKMNKDESQQHNATQKQQSEQLTILTTSNYEERPACDCTSEELTSSCNINRIHVLPQDFIHSISTQMLLLKETLCKTVEMFVFLSHPVLTTYSSSSIVCSNQLQQQQQQHELEEEEISKVSIRSSSSLSLSEWLPITVQSQDVILSSSAKSEADMMPTLFSSDVILPSAWLFNNLSNALIKPRITTPTTSNSVNENNNKETALEALHKSDEHIESKLHSSPPLTESASIIDVYSDTTQKVIELTDSPVSLTNEKTIKEQRESSETCAMKDGRWFTFMSKSMKKRCRCIEEEIALEAMPAGKLHEFTSMKALFALVKRELYKELMSLQDEFCAHMTLTINSSGDTSKGKSNSNITDSCTIVENEYSELEQLESKLQSTQPTQQTNNTTLSTKKSMSNLRPLVHIFQQWREIEQMVKTGITKGKKANSKTTNNNNDDASNTHYCDNNYNNNNDNHEHVNLKETRCDNDENSNDKTSVASSENKQEKSYNKEMNSSDTNSTSITVENAKCCLHVDNTSKVAQPEYMLDFVDASALTQFEKSVQSFNDKVASCRRVIDEVYTHYEWLVNKVICTCALPYLEQVYNEIVNEQIEFSKVKEEFARLNQAADVTVGKTTPLRTTRRRSKAKSKETITTNVEEVNVITNTDTSTMKDTGLNEVGMHFDKESRSSAQTIKQTKDEIKGHKAHLKCSEEHNTIKCNKEEDDKGVETSSFSNLDSSCASHTSHAMTNSQEDVNCYQNIQRDGKCTIADCPGAECTNTIKEAKRKKPIKSRKIEILTSLKKSDQRYINTLSTKAAKTAALAAAAINGKSHNESALTVADTNVNNNNEISSSSEENVCNHVSDTVNTDKSNSVCTGSKEELHTDNLDKKDFNINCKNVCKADSIGINVIDNTVDNNLKSTTTSLTSISSEDGSGVKLKKDVSIDSSSTATTSSTSPTHTPTSRNKKNKTQQQDKSTKNVVSTSTIVSNKSKAKPSVTSTAKNSTTTAATKKADIITNAVNVNTQKAQAIRRQIVQQILTNANTTKRQKVAQLHATTSSSLSSSSTHLLSKSDNKRGVLTATQIGLAFVFVGIAVLAVLMFFL